MLIKKEIIKKYKITITSTILSAFLIIYGFIDPARKNIFPKCAFYVLTGYQCPGCGSQRAIHSLLNFNFIDAIKYNLLFVLLLPYMFFGIFVEFFKIENKKIHTIYYKLYGYKAAIAVFLIITLYWIIRNMTFYKVFINRIFSGFA